ncbi:Fc receptor-like protein 5, partial [Anabas testudineus]|uniref:Fc receptor-like protein 5 n=1 Tax=Anabas testudineus TaxID=64144 RepID=UPI00143D820F
VLTLEPNWSSFFTGESVTFICDMKEGKDTDWEYKINKDGREFVPYNSSYTIETLSTVSSGRYQCSGHHKSSNDTKTSNIISLTVSDKPNIKLTAGPTIIPVGGRVNLSCSVDDSDGWKYDWFRRTSNSNEAQVDGEENRDIRVSQGGIYRCRGRRGKPVYYTDYSDEVTVEITVSNKAVVKMQNDWSQIFRGETITLTCEIQDGGDTEWEYEWKTSSSETSPKQRERWIFTASASSGGNYWCQGKVKMDFYFPTEWSDPLRLTVTLSNRVVVTLHPNCSEIYHGEMITVRCEIQGGDTEWEYEWETTSSIKPSNQNEFRISSASSSHSGNYRCKGRKKNAQYKTTEWSDFIKLTVNNSKSNKPQSVLTVSPSWLSPGASVTLKCEVEHPSAGWRFYWYKTVPKLSDRLYRYELLPGSDSGTEEDSYMVHGQTHTAGYVCRAGRGEPVFHTEHRKPTFVWSGDFPPSASLTVSPDRVQHFTSDSVSLSCEGNSTEWRVRRFPEDSYLSPCSDWGTMTGSTCNISGLNSSAVYWCESGSGQFTNSVNITGHNADIILMSPVHPVTEGQSVSLGCRLKTGQKLSNNVFFYQNDKLLQNHTRVELIISAVSKSHEGFYKCQHSGKESPQSWMTVKRYRPESSSFTVPFVSGLVGGILLTVFLQLLLLCFYRKINGEVFSY